MSTTLAIPAWHDLVSTTFDFARELLVIEVAGRYELSRQEVQLGDEPPARRARRLRDLGVQTVLCGTVSKPLAEAVSQAGIEIIPYVAGKVNVVVAAHLCGQLGEPRFLQPGCRPGARRRWRHGCAARGARGQGRR